MLILGAWGYLLLKHRNHPITVTVIPLAVPYMLLEIVDLNSSWREIETRTHGLTDTREYLCNHFVSNRIYTHRTSRNYTAYTGKDLE